MKRFLTKIVLFGLVFAIILVIGICLPLPNSNSPDHARLDKHRRLRSLPPPRIIILGGSNTPYGIYSPLIEQQLGYSVVNAGVVLGYGIRFMLDDHVPFIQPGDIVVFIPEYQLYTRKLNNADVMPALQLDYGTALRLSPLQLVYQLGYFPMYALQRYTYLPKVLWPEKDQLREEALFERDGFNEYGDITNHWGHTRDELREYPPIGDANPRIIAYIQRIAQLLQQHGAAFFVSFPSYVQTQFDKDRETIEAIHTALQQDQVPLLGTPERYSFPRTLHFNTYYHLTREGQHLRTRQLIEDLQTAGIVPRTTQTAAETGKHDEN